MLLRLLRLLGATLLLCASPVLFVIPAVALAVADLLWALFGRKHPVKNSRPRNDAATVVIPNWNGRDLLAKYLPSVIDALHGNPRNELIVVDNGSTDGSVEFLQQHFPQVRVLALKENLGFGGGSNTGFREATNDIVVLLNSDMRVDPDFLAPLLSGFEDSNVFAVAAQILFTDPTKRREETGLTQGWWQDGMFRVAHRIDNQITGFFPCFYPGGGSSAFDRRKFLELGGFDNLLHPFYGEDTDLGYLAWKRGWKVLFQPSSLVWHEHRGTIGKKFSTGYIEAVLQKNFVLLCWKNIHEPGRMAEHLFLSWCGSAISLFAGNSRERVSLNGWARAGMQLPGALAARWRARRLAVISDTEALRRPLGGYYYDRFSAPTVPQRLRVLFLSPYPVQPALHGGAVFMLQTIRHLLPYVDLHLIVLLESPAQIADHEALRDVCASVEYLVRMPSHDLGWGTPRPHAVREFFNRDLEWLIHKQFYLNSIDVFQIEYTHMGQYACEFQRIVTCLFEHDIYFQSVSRQLGQTSGFPKRVRYSLEYLRALNWELRMLRKVDRIQTCTRENASYLSSFEPALAAHLDHGLRAGIDVARYEFRTQGRRPATMLFLGSFRHLPNQHALSWFLDGVLPKVLAGCPEARLVIVGSDPPPAHVLAGHGSAVELRGYVEDVREVLAELAVFVCPILAGSGVRVKLLEAFAAGIPVVSTTIGAEGLATVDGETCRLADTGAEFAARILELLDQPNLSMVERARREVDQHWDIPVITSRLLESYIRAREHKATRPVPAGR